MTPRSLSEDSDRSSSVVGQSIFGQAPAGVSTFQSALPVSVKMKSTKPLQRDALERVIAITDEQHRPEEIMSSSTDPNPDLPSESIENPARIQSTTGNAETAAVGTNFTFDVMVERLDNDEEIAREIAAIFVSSSAELLQELVAAVADGDAQLIRAHAHSIKGSAGNIGAEELHDLAGAMECAGRDSDLQAAERLLPGLCAVLERINRVLSDCG